MCDKFTRRQMLRHAAAMVGLATAGRAERLWSAPATPRRPPASLPVAIERSTSYEPRQLRQRLDAALDAIGGVGPLVRGKTVTIKLNLTGGPRRGLGGLPAHRTYHVHPHFVAATCAALHDAGAKKIVLVEGGYDRQPLEQVMAGAGWDVAMIAEAGGHKVTWEDTRHRGPWKSYSRLTVPWGGYIYPAFELNSRYEKTDVFVSLAKLKDHANAGVTMAVKNLFGMAPTSIYGDHYDNAGKPTVNEQGTTARADTFHRGTRLPPAGVPQEVDPNSPRRWSYRVPRVTADLFGVRPPDLSLVDGIETNRGGEGPWIKGVQPVAPQLLFAGRNGVCTDAVCAAAMGYNPNADHRQFPFMGDNHLKLLAEQGMGTNIVDEIDLCGLPLKEAVYPFNPKRLEIGKPIFQ